MRQHRGHREQAQRRDGRLLGNEPQGVLETPERVGRSRADQKYFHRQTLTARATLNLNLNSGRYERKLQYVGRGSPADSALVHAEITFQELARQTGLGESFCTVPTGRDWLA